MAWGVYMTCVRRVQKREHVAGARSRVGMSRSARQVITGAQGDMIQCYGDVWLCGGGPRAVLWRRTYLTANGISQLAAGAFLGDLERSWGYQIIRGLIWDIHEVHISSPWMEGPNWRYWWTWFGGSNGLWQQMV